MDVAFQNFGSVERATDYNAAKQNFRVVASDGKLCPIMLRGFEDFAGINNNRLAPRKQGIPRRIEAVPQSHMRWSKMSDICEHALVGEPFMPPLLERRELREFLLPALVPTNLETGKVVLNLTP
jgi:hypothetical protein